LEEGNKVGNISKAKPMAGEQSNILGKLAMFSHRR